MKNELMFYNNLLCDFKCKELDSITQRSVAQLDKTSISPIELAKLDDDTKKNCPFPE